MLDKAGIELRRFSKKSFVEDMYLYVVVMFLLSIFILLKNIFSINLLGIHGLDLFLIFIMQVFAIQMFIKMVIDNKKNKIGKSLAKFRMQKELSISKVAHLIGVSDDDYLSWERGLKEPKIEYLIKLSHVFNVSLDILLTDIEREQKYIVSQLKEYRQLHKLTTQEMASGLCVDVQVYELWEKLLREPNLHDVVVIADFLGITVDELFGVENRRENEYS